MTNHYFGLKGLAMKINGQEYTLLRDYDKGKYHYLSFDGEVTYLRERVDFILLNPCRKAMSTAKENDLGLVLATAICAGISAASTFLNGKDSRGQDKTFFLGFVRRYLNPALQDPISSLSITWAEWLYRDVRCGLAHGFMIHNGGVEYEVSNFIEEKPCGPEISPKLLLEEFSKGWTKYLGEVLNGGPSKNLGLLFEQRFKQIFND